MATAARIIATIGTRGPRSYRIPSARKTPFEYGAVRTLNAMPRRNDRRFSVGLRLANGTPSSCGKEPFGHWQFSAIWSNGAQSFDETVQLPVVVYRGMDAGSNTKRTGNPLCTLPHGQSSGGNANVSGIQGTADAVSNAAVLG